MDIIVTMFRYCQSW